MLIKSHMVFHFSFYKTANSNMSILLEKISKFSEMWTIFFYTECIKITLEVPNVVSNSVPVWHYMYWLFKIDRSKVTWLLYLRMLSENHTKLYCKPRSSAIRVSFLSFFPTMIAVGKSFVMCRTKKGWQRKHQ